MSKTLIINNIPFEYPDKGDRLCLTCGATESPRWAKKGTECNNCYCRRYKQENKEAIKIKKKEYRLKNKDKINAAKRAYRAKTEKHRASVQARKALKRSAMPNWVCTKEIKQFYLNCPENMTVDHIIPLKNSMVCGLHVPQNLTYLSHSDNARKWNKFDGTYENKGWCK